MKNDYWPSQGPSFFGSRYAGVPIVLATGMVPTRTFFFVKNEKGPRTRWDSLLALTRQNGAAKAPSIGTAPIQRRRLFSLKKHRIDGFPPPFSPEKYAERECRRAKTASRKCSSPGRGHFRAVSFFSPKKLAKKRKNQKLKKGPGHGGIRRSWLRSKSKRGENQKTEIPQGQTKQKSILLEKQKIR